MFDSMVSSHCVPDFISLSFGFTEGKFDVKESIDLQDVKCQATYTSGFYNQSRDRLCSSNSMKIGMEVKHFCPKLVLKL